MNLYVGNISFKATEEDLKTAFEQYGSVVKVNIIKDRFSGESRGFGFVEMSSNDEGKAAIDGMNGNELDGRRLKVNEAHAQGERRGGGARRN